MKHHYPTMEVVVTVCQRCGDRIERPHTDSTCPMSSGSGVIYEYICDEDPLKRRPIVRW